ncbi:hypothetical protein JVT61DRAFT_6316 [Boletus reticuloceps]|uniref:Uncharacterized protein n=1 Tax=Boletus reticuloceps TaxID=495285 RepID=A0A8I3A6S5_9AGAM|nr:hypothetical protein JVT61DRAFT_6316 [Boletus reticuloceps]
MSTWSCTFRRALLTLPMPAPLSLLRAVRSIRSTWIPPPGSTCTCTGHCATSGPHHHSPRPPHLAQSHHIAYRRLAYGLSDALGVVLDHL